MNNSPWDLNKKYVVDSVKQVVTHFKEQNVENCVALGLESTGRNIQNEHTILICTQSLFWNMVAVQSFNRYLNANYTLGIMLGTRDIHISPQK